MSSQGSGSDGETPLSALRAQVEAAAEAFADGEDDLAELLRAIGDDVERAATEPVEVLPVGHHSPASAVHAVRRLRAKDPEVVYVELPGDLRGLVEDLAECRLPVALQAFASDSATYPAEWLPLTVVAPLTDFSAECQTLAYAHQTDTDLVFVDRDVDHVFRRIDRDADPAEADWSSGDAGDSGGWGSRDDDEGEGLDPTVGLQIGNTEPTFEAFRRRLLRNARVRHWSEWWAQYVEEPTRTAEYETYRHAMFLVGSLLRRLGRGEDDRESDRFREGVMWTRIRRHMRANDVDPGDALYVCGAAHAVSPVEAFGVDGTDVDVPDHTDTDWQYGLVPTSYRDVERQFGHPPGTIRQAEHTWEKTRSTLGLASFSFDPDMDLTAFQGADRRVSDRRLAGPTTDPGDPGASDGEETGDAGDASGRDTDAGSGGDSDASTAESGGDGETGADRLAAVTEETDAAVARPPDPVEEDDEQLLDWSIGIVERAREHGYQASTADAIAVYEHATLLANVRNRPHPTPYDFREAAVTCLETTDSPGRRDVADLCGDLLGGDRTGTVGYGSMPPLAQDVYDRLDELPVDPTANTIERALLDFEEHPEYREASDLLWRLDFLFEEADVVRPIVGQRELGRRSTQESWDLLTGKNQRPLIELGYEGVTVEQVVEARLREAAFGDDADAVSALEAVEDAILYLDRERLTRELGERAGELLTDETGPENAETLFERARELVQYYRSQPDGVPDWLERYVATGYSHYAGLIPQALGDDTVPPEDVAGTFAFVFRLEALALSVGADRSELEVAVQQAGEVEVPPEKAGLLWTAEWLLDRRTLDEVRAFFDTVFETPALAGDLRAYLTGFVLAMRFTRRIGEFVAELVGETFGRLPDRRLFPWLPDLLTTVEAMDGDVVAELLRTAVGGLPDDVDGYESWTSPWGEAGAVDADTGDGDADGSGTPDLSDRGRSAATLLRDHGASTTAAARALDAEGDWTPLSAVGAGAGADRPDSPTARAVRRLLFDHRPATDAAAGALGADGDWGSPSGGQLGGADGDARGGSPVRALLADHGAAAAAAGELFGGDRSDGDGSEGD